MVDVLGKFYKYTGAIPGTGAALTSDIEFPSSDGGALNSYPMKRGTGTVYSYIVALAYYFEADPGLISSICFWPSIVGGSLDSDVTIKIATTLQTTYKQATGTSGSTGTPIATLYTGVTTEDIFNYNSGSPRVVAAADQILTTGIGRYTNFILLQMEAAAAADLGAVPVSDVTIRLNHAVVESPA